MSASSRDGYKRTVYDRRGPEDAQFSQTVGSLIIPIVAGAFIGGALAAQKDIYASNRLVDLYLAWPGHETKGLREFRRLIDTYPETDVAERARAGLANLKSQLGATE